MDRVKVALGFYRDGVKEEVIDCTNDLKNWDDVTISLNRSDYTGVVRAISTKFEFVGETKSKIDAYYEEYYLGTQIRINVYQINERWGYDLIFQGDLDFSTLEKSEYVLSINAKDNTLSSVIKANKSTKFDIPTTDVRADKKLKYDRINILNRVQWTTDDANEETNEAYKFSIKLNMPTELQLYSNVSYYIPIPLAYLNENTFRCAFEYKDQSAELIKADINDGTIGIVTALNNNPFRINTNFVCKLSKCVGKASIVIGKLAGFTIASQQLEIGEETIIDLNAPITNAKGLTFGIFLKIELTNYRPNGEPIVLEYYSRKSKEGYYQRGSIAYAECFGKGKETEFNCIDITKLANTLVRNIYPNASVEIDTLPTQCVLVSGEDMRELNNAKVSTSFSEFSTFMETCFGFTYTINDNIIRFGKREDLFSRAVVKEVTSYSELNFSQDTSLMYSRVKVGYNKQDYNNTNGKNEFNQSIEYSTDVNLTDNTLELISPYRADSLGFEFKTQEIENQVKDSKFSLEDEDKNEVDKDIFVIEVDDKNSYYKVHREYTTFIPNAVFSNGVDIGIKSLYINKEIDEIKELTDFTNYYLTAYLKDAVESGYTIFRFAPVNNGNINLDEAIILNIPTQTGVVTYIRDEAIITIDWDVIESNLGEFNVTTGDGLLKYPVSYSCYKRNPFNYGLNPQQCALRNQFMFLPCTQNLIFASTDGNSNIEFYKTNLVRLDNDLSFGGRDMTVNKITFTTDETTLPTDKSGKVMLVTNGKTYEGWIISAIQNIGKNEPSEYELILAQS